MLVLSRKENERVLFPHLGIAVQILRVGGGKARLGIDAPENVSIVRHEIASDEQLAAFSQRLKQTASGNSHEARNRLHTALLSLSLVHKQLSLNRIDDAQSTLEQLMDNMQQLDGASAASRCARNGHRRKALVVEDNS